MPWPLIIILVSVSLCLFTFSYWLRADNRRQFAQSALERTLSDFDLNHHLLPQLYLGLLHGTLKHPDHRVD